MATKKTKTEKEIVEQYRVALVNVKSQPEIAVTMAEFGYPTETVDKGQVLYDATAAAYTLHDTEDDETSAASGLFKSKKSELERVYGNHRKKSKVAYRKDKVTADKLKITGSLAKAYVPWLDTVKKFYTVAVSDTAVQTKLALYKITLEDLSAGSALITDVENARSEYLRETGESQDATKSKDTALGLLDEWMQEFYAVARIALEDKPQLLEVLGLLVRS